MNRNYEAMKGSLLEQICTTLGQHEIAYEKQGVEANLDCYGANKFALIDLLREHPNWDEESLAVVYNGGDIRKSSAEEINALRLNLENLAQELFDNGEVGYVYGGASAFKKALVILCDDKQFIDTSTVNEIRRISKVESKVGQRASRVIDKLCDAYGIKKHSNYSAVFTALADALNPLTIEHKSVLSVHPCDYLEMANGDGWHSGFRLGSQDKRGRYIAGTLSHLNDSVSMVFYTVDKNAKAPYYRTPKINCGIFCYENGVLLQSKLYPDNTNEDAVTVYRNLVQQIFAECLSQTNLWTLRRNSYMTGIAYELNSFLKSCDEYSGNDYAPIISLLKSKYPKGFQRGSERLVMGDDAFCLKCGNPISKLRSVYCESCAG